MASDNPGGDLEWLSDYIVTMLRSPTWVVPVSEFMDSHCILFDEDLEESPLEHTKCHEDFKQLVCSLFALHLAEVSVTEEQFERFCDCGLSENTRLHRVLAEQLIAVEDFLTFRALMAKQNADIHREIANLEVDGDETFDSTFGVTGMANAVVQNSVADGLVAAADDEWQVYDSQLFATGMGLTSRSEHGNRGMQEAQARCEEAELEQAIALSLQIEEERLRHIAAGEEPESLVPHEEAIADVLAAALQPDEPPAITRLPGGAGFVSAPMIPLPPRPHGITTAAALPRIVQVEPLKPRAWGFTSAPLMPLPPPIPASEDQLEAGTPDEVATTSVEMPTSVPKLPGRAGFLSSPLCVVPPQPKIPVGSSVAAADVAEEPAEHAPPAPPAPPPSAAAELDGLNTNLQLWRARAEKAMEPVTPNLRQTRSHGCPWNASAEPEMPTVRQGPTEEERRQRAEHLKQLRDRLIEKRQRDRERQLAELNPHLACASSAAAAGIDEAARSRHLIAELTPGAVVAGDSQPPTQDPENKAEKMRQALTLQLRQSLMRSMVSDAGVLDNQLSQLESMRWR